MLCPLQVPCGSEPARDAGNAVSDYNTIAATQPNASNGRL
ncbi:hypothetical protein SAMN04488697_10965 [Pseudomonas sp. 43mfcvi1.1]|nr:hypothetical protein ATJ40_10965 [Pseudomonas sp. 43mfcvi1.1]SSB97720.1 hypothetical protein SAMN04488697_10965 [Pseudomonas sp. 43mfcvi1.1]